MPADMSKKRMKNSKIDSYSDDDKPEVHIGTFGTLTPVYGRVVLPGKREFTLFWKYDGLKNATPKEVKPKQRVAFTERREKKNRSYKKVWRPLIQEAVLLGDENSECRWDIMSELPLSDLKKNGSVRYTVDGAAEYLRGTLTATRGSPPAKSAGRTRSASPVRPQPQSDYPPESRQRSASATFWQQGRDFAATSSATPQRPLPGDNGTASNGYASNGGGYTDSASSNDLGPVGDRLKLACSAQEVERPVGVSALITPPGGARGFPADVLEMQPKSGELWVTEWLRGGGLEEYAPAFIELGFTSPLAFDDLSGDDLKELGVSKLGHQKILRKLCERLQ